ncbi:MAG: hypothetical protein KDD82_28345 [Planctomycetes bacterium]|nr:hypothetical protein [Planctomycetota bacterium]
MSTPLLCVFCRDAMAQEESRCPACGVTAHRACREEFGARACPTIGCAGDRGADPATTWEANAARPRAGSARLLGCASFLSVALIFPFAVGLLWIGSQDDADSVARFVDQLETATAWRGEPVNEARPVYLEGLVLQPRPGTALVPSPLGGEGLLFLDHQRWFPHRRGGGGSWREHASSGVACVTTWQGRPVALDLEQVRFPFGLQPLGQEGRDRVLGLRPGAKVTVFTSHVNRSDPRATVGAAWVFLSESWDDTLRQARAREQRTRSTLGTLGLLGWLCLVLGVGGGIAATAARLRLRRR